MVVFIVPIKSRAVATSWPTVCALFERTLRSICAQTSSDFRVLVVCNERPAIGFEHPNVTYVQVDFPPPVPEYGPKMDDRSKKVVAGLVAARALHPSHVMLVDADDCISARIAAFVAQHPHRNGWFVDQGYEYRDGSDRVTVRRRAFNKMCGSCNIIRYDLFTLPDVLPPHDEITGYDRFLTGHSLAEPDLAARGTPLEPLPFPGAVYVRDRIGESVSLQESVTERLRRNWREQFRGIKKFLRRVVDEQPLTDELRAEFGLRPLAPSASG